MTVVLETDRLRLRRFSPDDAPFVLALLNDADFLRIVGDRGVRTVDDARRYIEERLDMTLERPICLQPDSPALLLYSRALA